MNNYFVILAAGKSKRFHNKIAKQFYNYKNKEIIDHSIDKSLGSNLFNIMFVLGISALVVPLDTKGIKSSDLYVMLAVTILLLPTVKTGLVIDRKEGLLFLGIYFGYIYYLWPE